MTGHYHSGFTVDTKIMNFLRNGKILGENEQPSEMVDRVVQTIVNADRNYTNDNIDFEYELGQALDARQIIFSTPILTNAGRYKDRPLSACTVPSHNLYSNNREELTQEVIKLHRQGMGTGFNLDDASDPVFLLKYLNGVAVDGVLSGKENRPVGNMAVLSVYHPKISDFISAKLDKNVENWLFNLSVDVDDNFMKAVKLGQGVRLRDGREVSAAELFGQMCNVARRTGCPGLIFLERMNNRNPAPELGEYRTTAPCAEVGLVAGEVCQFGYINVAEFVKIDGEKYQIDKEGLQRISALLTRALDNALDVSYENLISERSRDLLLKKRKIGVGLCGVADALAIIGLPYDSQEARDLMKDIMALVNYSTKLQSIKLAQERGSCLIIKDGGSSRLHGNTLEDNFGKYTSSYVAKNDWQYLDNLIINEQALRNISTTALPPTGRSSLVIGASTGIEPHFCAEQVSPKVIKCGKKIIYAKDISPINHLAMVQALQQFCDESISKTVNLPSNATTDEIAEIYMQAYDMGLNGVTIYVDGSRDYQPIALTDKKEGN